MEITSILTIIGIIISASFGVWGIIITVKKHYVGELLFLKESTISLFDEITKNIPKLSVTYDRRVVKPNLVLIKAAFVNSGSVDISTSMTESPLTISLVKSNWLEATVVGKSPSLDVNINLLGQKDLIINTGLWRKNEFVRIQALAEVNNDEHFEGEHEIEEMLENDLTINHRIKDTKKVMISELMGEKYLEKRFKRYIILPIIGLVLTAIMIFIVPKKDKFLYTVNIENVGIKDVIVSKIAGDLVFLKEYQGDFKGEYNVNTFFSMFTGTAKIVKSAENLQLLIAISIMLYILLPGFLAFLRFAQLRKTRKLKKLLYAEEDIA